MFRSRLNLPSVRRFLPLSRRSIFRFSFIWFGNRVASCSKKSSVNEFRNPTSRHVSCANRIVARSITCTDQDRWLVDDDVICRASSSSSSSSSSRWIASFSHCHDKSKLPSSYVLTFRHRPGSVWTRFSLDYQTVCVNWQKDSGLTAVCGYSAYSALELLPCSRAW